jgi:hypothetical protein
MNAYIKRALKYVLGFLLVALCLLALYTWASLTWVYSSGERAGYVQKFSNKGYLCKTWEGELILVSMPGTQAEKFQFTVRDDNVAKKINASIGKRVKIDYIEHKGIPSTCFGETAYFVENIQVLQNQSND